ncbi:MAG: hypothetical protein GX654_09935 [Desulfatiglans sp.]|nr:hypothetical protein [Desulfatiglans sp.]
MSKARFSKSRGAFSNALIIIITIAISLSMNKSILWAIIHSMFSWRYCICYFLSFPPNNAGNKSQYF